MILTEISINHYQTKQLLNESWQQLSESQQLYVCKWETTVWPLVESLSHLLEADLTPAQISAVFKNAEQLSISQGTGKTALGKAGSVTANTATKLKTEIQKLMNQAQNSGPVKNLDQQFENLKRQLSIKLQNTAHGSSVLSTVNKWKTFAEENPVKGAFIIGAMTALLAFASGSVVSGAAIGFFLKLANNVIKGDKLSSAVGKSVKGAAIGAVFGGIADSLGKLEIENIATADIEDIQEFESTLEEANAADTLSQIDPQLVEIFPDLSALSEYDISGNYNNYEYQYNFYATPDQLDQINQLSDELKTIRQTQLDISLLNNPDWISDRAALEENTYIPKFLELQELFNEIQSAPEQDVYKQAIAAYKEVEASKELSLDQLNQIVSKYDSLADKVDAMANANSALAAAIQGAVTASTGNKSNKNESIEDELWTALSLYEAGFADVVNKVKQQAAPTGKAVAKGAAKGAKAVGKELGQKVTVAKLSSMWKRAGKPTDVGSISNILQSAGLTDEQIGLISKSSNVNLAQVAEPVDLTALAQQIKQLGHANTVKSMLSKGNKPRNNRRSKRKASRSS